MNTTAQVVSLDPDGPAGKGGAKFAPMVLAGTPKKGRVGRNLSAATTFAIMADYKAGRPIKEIAYKYGVTKQCVSNIAKRRGLKLRIKHFDARLGSGVVEAYLCKTPIKAIAVKFECTIGCVRYALKRADVKLTRKPRKGT